eukprot:1290251-Pleurochrysis_carterae.AAC.3
MEAHADTHIPSNYDMRTGLHLAALCPFKQIQECSPLLFSLFVEKYLQALPIVGRQNFYSLPKSAYPGLSCERYLNLSRSNRRYRSQGTIRTSTGMR